VRFIQPDYCSSGPAITVLWDYFDSDDDMEEAYQVQIDFDSNFSDPIYIDSEKIISGSIGYFANLGNNYSTTFYARVRVWDERGGVSQFSQTRSFDTAPYRAPKVEFIWSPSAVLKNQTIQFVDETIGDSKITSWNWDFGCSNSFPLQCEKSESSEQNPTNVYYIDTPLNDPYIMELTVGDGYYTCSKTRRFHVGPNNSPPYWIEVAP
jgi:PKD repeat protein